MGELKRRGQIWWIRYYKNGKRHEESSGSTKEGEAKSLLRLREGDIERGVAVTPKVGRIRFDEAVTDVLNDYRTNRKRSLDDVERRIEKHLKPFFGNRRMASITTADIREYIASRQKETHGCSEGVHIHGEGRHRSPRGGTAPHDSRRVERRDQP